MADSEAASNSESKKRKAQGPQGPGPEGAKAATEAAGSSDPDAKATAATSDRHGDRGLEALEKSDGATASAATLHPALYHLDVSAEEARIIFAGVDFVVMGGTEARVSRFAEMLAEQRDLPWKLVSGPHARFRMLRVGNVLAVNHGMGAPSISILLNEVVSGLRGASPPRSAAVLVRIGTSGGVGVAPGSVVVSTALLNELLEPEHEVIVMGERRRLPTRVDAAIVERLRGLELESVVFGATMSANDFYNNQGRLDGPFCDFSAADKDAFLRRLHAAGVRNIEMEGVCFTALAHLAGLRAVVVCMPLVDRLLGDQPHIISNPHRALQLVIDHVLTHP